uniref:Uncharacterized protein n=1 Tax=Caenorhabditis japonica TaxID=281687 RepID=A0A8R1IC87_CAEJA
MFDEKDEDPTKPLISQVKFAEAVKLVNSRSEPFSNMLEWLIPTQNKIACFTGTTCYRKRAVCLLGPNGKIQESDFDLPKDTPKNIACTSIFFAFSLLVISFFLW